MPAGDPTPLIERHQDVSDRLHEVARSRSSAGSLPATGRRRRPRRVALRGTDPGWPDPYAGRNPGHPTSSPTTGIRARPRLNNIGGARLGWIPSRGSASSCTWRCHEGSTPQTRHAGRCRRDAARGGDGRRRDRPAGGRLAGQQRPGERDRPQPERRRLGRRRRLARRRRRARAVGDVRAGGRQRASASSCARSRAASGSPRARRSTSTPTSRPRRRRSTSPAPAAPCRGTPGTSPARALGGEKQIFASRFVAAANTWQPEGQDRGSGVPSLNIHTDKEAENPSVAGGAAVAGADPVPWVAWEEEDGNVAGSGNHDQIFVSKGVKQAAPKPPCTGFKPSDATQREQLLLAAGRPRPARQGRRLVRHRRSDAEHRPEPQRRRARHRVHRRRRHRRAGPSGTRRTPATSACATTSRSSPRGSSQDPSADGGFSWRAVGNGTAGQNNILDTTGAERLRQLRRLDRRPRTPAR